MAHTQGAAVDYSRWPRAQDASGRVYLYHDTDRVWLWRRVPSTAAGGGSSSGGSYLHNVITNEVKWPQQLSAADARDAGVVTAKVTPSPPPTHLLDSSHQPQQTVNTGAGAWITHAQQNGTVASLAAGGAAGIPAEGKKGGARFRSRFADAASQQVNAGGDQDAVAASLQTASSAIEAAKGSISFHAVFPSSAVPSIFPSALVDYARRSLAASRAAKGPRLNRGGAAPTRAATERAVWREVLHLASQAHQDGTLRSTAWAQLPPATGADFGSAVLSQHANATAIADVLSGGDGNGAPYEASAAPSATPYCAYGAKAVPASGWSALNGTLPQGVTAGGASASQGAYGYGAYGTAAALQAGLGAQYSQNKRKLANPQLPAAKRTAGRYWENKNATGSVTVPSTTGAAQSHHGGAYTGSVTDARAMLNAKRYGDKTRFGGRTPAVAAMLVKARTSTASQPSMIAATSTRVRRLLDVADKHVGVATGVLFTRDYALVPANQTAVFSNADGDDVRSTATRGPVLVGRNMTVEKDFLRLTAEADAALVRPESVLRQALTLVQQRYRDGDTDYAWVCRQLKSIRQDLLVQAIENDLTEAACLTHARVALENSDVGEFNQCLTRLVELASARRRPLSPELSGYRLLYAAYSGSALAVASLLADMSPTLRCSPPVWHARRVWRALTNRNAYAFFRLYEDAPGMNASLMDLFAGALRADVLRSWVAAYRPGLPLPEVVARLGWRYTHSGKDDQLVAMARAYITDRGGRVDDSGDGEAPVVVCGRSVVITPDDTAARITCMAAGRGGL
ncbi:hypothetical protein BU14_0245s0019 [Porphyra umbilicalis]|uniref:SAC3/GANP/THP3 conserved domain-containing protein n=1 Tax=Porphyra umbilicalis TaxID=2786 RepID=A0A1X6P340_PORUM|nr:hypothetical protein BU14_0245s0019 [Porphyra umbilicalis]|eukprot:OSX75237.1 hypothetical protein BU14_0245s0019 [Porphyra umbilicalis]